MTSSNGSSTNGGTMLHEFVPSITKGPEVCFMCDMPKGYIMHQEVHNGQRALHVRDARPQQGTNKLAQRAKSVPAKPSTPIKATKAEAHKAKRKAAPTATKKHGKVKETKSVKPSTHARVQPSKKRQAVQDGSKRKVLSPSRTSATSRKVVSKRTGKANKPAVGAGRARRGR
jgi:hypothetical protein